MKEYVLVNAIAFPSTSEPKKCLLVLKDKPLWQKGFLNLIGGKVEEDETPNQAAIRELKEETGLEVSFATLMGKMTAETETIYCFNVYVDSSLPLKPRTGETEIVRWFQWSNLLNDSRLIPNLRIVIPLMFFKISGWTMKIPADFMEKEHYDLSLNMMSNKHKRFRRVYGVSATLEEVTVVETPWYKKLFNWF